MITSDERALLDTKVLVYAADAGSPFHEAARRLRDRGFLGEVPLVVSPQVLLEFFAVIPTGGHRGDGQVPAFPPHTDDLPSHGYPPAHARVARTASPGYPARDFCSLLGGDDALQRDCPYLHV
jgi:hypothetical protein